MRRRGTSVALDERGWNFSFSGVVSSAEMSSSPELHMFPARRPTSWKLGLMVRVDGDALHQLNTWLYDHEEVLVVQIHAHPTEAFHSATDDTYPIVTAEGSISIVAADFCRQGLLSESTAVYRLDNQSWLELDPPLGMFRVN